MNLNNYFVLILLVHMDLYGSSTVDVQNTDITCDDIKENENYKYSSNLDMNDISLSEETWEVNGKPIAIIHYDDTSQINFTDDVISAGSGTIILCCCRSINYTALFTEKTKGLRERRIYYKAREDNDHQFKKDEECKSRNRWIILGTVFAFLIVMVLIVFWIKWPCRKDPNKKPVENV